MDGLPDSSPMPPAPPEITSPVARVLAVRDAAASIAFYRHVLGFQERPLAADVAAGAVAELVLGPARLQLVARKAPADVSGEGVVIFFEASDVRALHAAIRARGGRPGRVERVNWIKQEVFELRDPDGHTLWFGQSFARPVDVRPAGLLEKALPELPCDDVAAAVAYYRDVLGFQVNYQQHDLGVMERDDVTLLLVPRARAGVGATEFYVRDADALYIELRGSGANVLGEPVSQPWGLRDFHVLDLDGNRLSFAQPFE